MNIILSGFMGSGKTTLARELAQRLDMSFVDIDEFIHEKSGMTVSQIFELYSESKFRELEREAVADLAQCENTVIATGGGTILNSINVNNLKKNGIIVYLDVSVDTVLRRLETDDTRPLLNRSDREDAVSQLMSGRLPIYKAAADLTFDANDDDLDIKVKKLIKKLRLDKQTI